MQMVAVAQAEPGQLLLSWSSARPEPLCSSMPKEAACKPHGCADYVE